jgi:hypothetical protein
MFKWHGLWSEYKEATLYVLAMMMVFLGVFFLISYLIVESLEQHTSPGPARPPVFDPVMVFLTIAPKSKKCPLENRIEL